MVRIHKKILFSKVQIVEIICLEYRLDFTIFILFCFSIEVSISLDYGCVALVLAQQYKVLFADCVE